MIRLYYTMVSNGSDKKNANCALIFYNSTIGGGIAIFLLTGLPRTETLGISLQANEFPHFIYCLLILHS